MQSTLSAEADMLRALAEPTRLRLAVILAVNGETCVCTLAGGLAEPEYKISRHLGILRSAGLVETRRAGTWMYYKLVPPGNHFEECLWRCFREDLAQRHHIVSSMKRMKKTSCEERKK